jgi:hypothetical protein
MTSLLMTLFLLQPLASDMAQEKANYRNQVLQYLSHRFSSDPFGTSYEAEKKLRFFGPETLDPIPYDKDGNPYHWITGAFSRPNASVMNFWFPNSLTKDF